MAILGINHSRLSTKGCSFNVSFSGKLGKIQSDYQSQMGKPVTVYIEVEGFPTESYYGGLKDAIRKSRFFHKHSYLDEVRKIYGDRPTYNRYHNPDNGYNSVYFLNPDEGISNQEREKYDFVVYDNLPVEPFLPHLK